MSKTAPILIIDDDLDDIYFLKLAIEELKIPNELVCLSSSTEVMDFLRQVKNKPMIIFCDINMPRKNGIELKMEIDADPVVRTKCIPFIFYSTSATTDLVDKAFVELHVQGYFQKGNDHAMTVHTIKTILEYWRLCKHPSM